MTELEAVGTVSDRLVGGMMFHSDHADIMRVVGLGWKVHEDGYISDAKALRKVRRASIHHLGAVPPNGDQRRGEHVVTDGLSVGDVSASVACKALRSALVAWHEWESGTADVFRRAAHELRHNACLWDLVRGLQAGAEREMAEAAALIEEMDVCGWDMAHAFERMGDG